jgi:hypothetical protein
MKLHANLTAAVALLALYLIEAPARLFGTEWTNDSEYTVTVYWEYSGRVTQYSASGDEEWHTSESGSGQEDIAPHASFSDSSYSWDEPGFDGSDIVHEGNIWITGVESHEPPKEPTYNDIWDAWTYRDDWGSQQYGGTNWDNKNYGGTTWNDKSYGGTNWGDKSYGSTAWSQKNFGSENWDAWSYTDDWGDWSDNSSRTYTNYTNWTPDASGIPSNQIVTQTRMADYVDTTTSSRSGTRTGTRSGTVGWTVSGTQPWTRNGTVDWTRSGSVDWTQTGTTAWTQTGTRFWEHTGTRYWSDGHTESLYESSSESLSNSGSESTTQSGSDSVSDNGTDSVSDSGTDSVSDSGTDSLSDSSSDSIQDSKQSSTGGSEIQTRSVQGTGAIPVTALITASSTTGTYPATVTITWSSTNATSVAVTGPGLNSTAANGSTVVSGLGAGISTFTVIAQGQNGPASQSVAVSVAKAPLAVVANNKSRIYGAANPMFDATITGFLNGDTAAVVSGAPTLSCAATDSSGAGAYGITPTIGTLSAANYSFSVFNPGTLSVNKAALTATATGQTRTYGAANPAFPISYAGFVNGDTAISITPPIVSTTATAISAVGPYAITLAGGSATNYSLTLVNGTLTVTKAPLSVTADDKSKVYGSANPPLSVSYNGFVNGDTLSAVIAPAIATSATPASPVGSYSITLSGGSAANYSLTLTNGTLAVTKASLTVTADSKSRTYGATNPILTYTLGGFVNGDTAAVVAGLPALATSAQASSSVGAYAIAPSQGSLVAANYVFGPFNNGTLTVTKAPLTVAADDKSKIYGAATPAFTLSYTGLVNGDTSGSVTPPTATTTAVPGSPVGSYPINLVGGTAANYTLSLVSGTLSVTKAVLAITANNQSRPYGSANPSFTIAYAGFVNGDTASSIAPPMASTSATATSAVGSYPITLSGGSATNYSLTLASGTLTVTKAALTATANNQTKIYGAPNSALTISYVGFVNGDTASSITAPIASTTATTASSVGSYPISLSGASATNYTITLVSGTLTIANATLTATANNQSKIYGAANPTLTTSYSGFVNGDTANSIVPPMASTSATAASVVGNYPITLSGGSAANYSLALVNGSLSVTPAILTIAADDKTRPFAAANPPLTYAYSGFVNGDTAASVSGVASVTTAAQPTSNAGTYIITAAPGTLNSPNYQFVFANGTLTIVPKVVTFTFADLSSVYDGSAKTASAIPSDPNTTYLSDLTKGPSAGSYIVSATANGNYSGSGTGTLTISPKPVTFTFGNLAHVYDGTAKTAMLTPSDASATFTSDLTKGPNASAYLVSANATGNYSGAGSANLMIARAPQTIALTPNATTAFAGETKTFTASGGQNAYVWGGSAGASGSASDVAVTLSTLGAYTVTVSNAASSNFEASNTVTATIDVLSNHQVNNLTPVASSFTINDASSPMNGQTYGRIWQDGGWVAYLGRSGVRFNVTAQAWPAVKTIEVQSKPPSGSWASLATQSASTSSTTADVTLSVMLGEAAPGQPLVPASFVDGTPQTGQWAFRARVQDANGEWSDFSAEVPVEVILPITNKVVSGQTVPPAGELGNWFTASPVQSFSFPLWIP